MKKEYDAQGEPARDARENDAACQQRRPPAHPTPQTLGRWEEEQGLQRGHGRH